MSAAHSFLTSGRDLKFDPPTGVGRIQKLALDGGPGVFATSYNAMTGDRDQERLLRIQYAMRGSHGSGSALVHKLERRWQAATGRRHVVACRSGAAAVRLALESLGIGPGDEIICPADVCFTSTIFRSATGAIPVPVDISPHTLQIDPASVEEAITDRTRLIFAVNRYGTTPNYRLLINTAEKHGIQILEEATHSLGAVFEKRPVGSLGTASVWAFEGSHSGVRGNGAMFATDRAEVAQLARRLVLCGSDVLSNNDTGELCVVGEDGKPQHSHPGHQDEIAYGAENSRINERPSTYAMTHYDAAVAYAESSDLEDEVARRSANGAHLANRLSTIPGLSMPTLARGASHSYRALPILVQPDELGLPEVLSAELRDVVVAAMTAEGVWLDPWSSQPVGLDGGFDEEAASRMVGGAACKRSEFPTAKAVDQATFVIGNDRSPLGSPHSVAVMDQIGDAFQKVLVENASRICELAHERADSLVTSDPEAKIGAPPST